MMKVSNRKTIKRLAWKSFKANRLRNLFAILSIILTSVMFTSLFTAAIGVNNSIEQQVMRSVGGYAHGNFKELTLEQVNQLKGHPQIKEYGANRYFTPLYEGVFKKHYSELRYFDENSAKMFYSYPTIGTLPKGKFEFAADTKVIQLLGIQPKLGEKVSITYILKDQEITDTFTLCGYWEADELMPASEIALSREYVDEKLLGYTPAYNGDLTGLWDLECMFSNSHNIANNLAQVATDNGYQIDDSAKDNFLSVGVNWGYTSSQMENDNTMIFTTLGVGLLILLACYLIIYNIFLISVANDIRFYGLLKTIGTTKRQLKRILLYQALLLSFIGIPLGLLFGYFVGCQITPIIMSSLTSSNTYQTVNPTIFIGAAIFSLVTVLIGIYKPGKIASKVTPVEAVRYTEGTHKKKQNKKSRHGARIHRMAMSNLLRNKRKTAIVFVSLSISIILLNSIYSFVHGFDVDRYLSQFISSDFNIASANSFNVMKQFRFPEDVVSEDMINDVMKQDGIENYGKVYYNLNTALIDLTPDMVDVLYSGVPEDTLDSVFQKLHGPDAQDANIQLYGMDDYILDKLDIVEGSLDLDKLKSGNYILEVVQADDYKNPIPQTVFHHPGDQVEIDYVDEIEFTDDNTRYITKHHKKTYEVMALVKDNYGWDVRFYTTIPFILPSNKFIEDTGTNTTYSFMMDVKDSKEATMEKYLKEYTNTVNTDMSYESKETYRDDFDNFINTFQIIGYALSTIFAVIGLLNFINVILTGIITRKREFAILKSIGMTRKQLTYMLILEGSIYAGFTLLISTLFASILNVTLVKSFGDGYWFFDIHFTLLPIAVIAPILFLFSMLVPTIAYHVTGKESVVEQLRE